jgi:hypothetical protein
VACGLRSLNPLLRCNTDPGPVPHPRQVRSILRGYLALEENAGLHNDFFDGPLHPTPTRWLDPATIPVWFRCPV